MRGSVVFKEGEKVKALTVTPKADGVPEFDEMFKIVLFNTSVISDDVDNLQASLAKTDLTVNLTIKMNDDPHGVLGFPVTSKERDVAEDYYPGFKNTTKTNFTVQRTMGDVGDIEAVWGIYSDSGTNLPSMHDLLFLGTVPTSVKEVATKRRLGTGTVVLQFEATAGSWVSVPAAHQPSPADITSGFSISAWIQPAGATDGFIVAKTSPKGDRVYYGLKVKTQKVEPLTTIDFRYALKGNQDSQNAPIKVTGKALDDGTWHSILITVDSGYVGVYLDGVNIGNTQLGDKQTEDLPGNLAVGALPSGAEAFKGLMQDVIVYSRKLEPGEIKEIFETPSRKDVTPLSGYLRFPDKMRQAFIHFSSLDDAVEENNEVFSVRLISAKGGGRVSTNDYAGILKVLKSDNANGLFGFSSGCKPTVATTENITFNCDVDRRRGNHDTVTVKWKIYQMVNDALVKASADFVQSSGEVIFKPGDRQEVLSFTLKDDTLPELEERFTVKLESVSTADGLIGTTNISGASIDAKANMAEITVGENDHPYGLMEFATNLVAPPSGVVVKPLMQKPEVRVAEEARVATLMVVRAQGVVGTVKVEWLTMEGSAVSSGASADFQCSYNL
ncbi:adhesion G-protein coupled receptor V1-like [Lineus longissimus]|uniref:adhesion G-protein coupled receptor V1-like n=1 Tax=Lineus longissimus TaxID=88925 RepID=UPI00315D748B